MTNFRTTPYTTEDIENEAAEWKRNPSDAFTGHASDCWAWEPTDREWHGDTTLAADADADYAESFDIQQQDIYNELAAGYAEDCSPF